MHTVVLWDADKLLKRLALGEDSRVEFMEVVFNGTRVREPRRERIADELAAFGNTLGGALIFSVSDAGEVRPMSREMMDALEAYVSEICADSIYISGAAIEAVRYSGNVLGRAAQHDAATITGPLDRQIRDAVNFARRNTRVAARKAPGRVEIPQFNPRAVFEAVVNAAVHRDYSMVDSKIRLFLFDDRLELYSPGALPNTLPIEAMRQCQVTRNETLASLLRMLEVRDVQGAGDRQYFLEQRGEGVPIIFEETRALTGSEPVFELIGGAELRLTMPSARPPVPGIQGEVSVTSQGRPLGGATVLALYPNKTWMMEETDTLGRVHFGFHSDLPITIFCAAPAHRARVERCWRPPAPLSVELGALANGGSMVISERTGHLPGLAGRLNPILDNLDRMYLHATNVAIDEGRQQPVHFKLGESMRLTDVHGAEWLVRFVEVIGNSSVLEYEPPPPRSR